MIELAIATLCLSIPAPLPQDDRAESELARVPFRSEGHLILLDVHVEDSEEPYTFLLDSGASGAVIERSVAETLELETGRPQTRAKSNERGELTYEMVPSAWFRLGELEFQVNQVVVAPVEPMARMMMGMTSHGILGHRFLKQFTVEVDYERRELIVHDPKTYRYEGEGAEMPLWFNPNLANLPFTTVTIETAAGHKEDVRMLVDSGGSILGTFGLSDRRIIDAVVSTDAARVPAMGATGLANTTEGTMHSSYVTRLHRAHLGPFVVEKPTTSCSPGSGPDIDLFGAELLHRFRVVFDYMRKRLILEPTDALSDPTPSDRSGLFLVAAEDDADVRRIAFVTPGGAAEEAGLHVDDLVVTIDGKPAQAQSLHATRLLLLDTREFQLEIQRGDETLKKTLRPREVF